MAIDSSQLDTFADIGSGILLVLLGLSVLLVRPIKSVNVLFMTFSVAGGLTFILLNAPSVITGEAKTLVRSISRVLVYIFAGATLALVLRFPVPVRRSDAGPLAVAAALSVAALTIGRPWPADLVGQLIFLVWPSFMFLTIPLLFGSVLLALRFSRFEGPDAGRNRRLAAIMSGAMALYPGANAGAYLLPSLVYFFPLLHVALLVVLAGLWIRNTRVESPPGPRVARNLALLMLLLPLLGLVYATQIGEARVGSGGGLFGVARLGTVVLLAYAILKHQMLGLDTKARWTLSKSTVAALFLAVFFLVSEGAQAWLSSEWGPVFGIVAASALVFALSPLQRLADRFASRAIPEPSAPLVAGSSAHAAFRAGVRAALADGRVTRAEERHLAELAQRLGLGPMKALSLKEEVEREWGHGRRPRKDRSP